MAEVIHHRREHLEALTIDQFHDAVKYTEGRLNRAG